MKTVMATLFGLVGLVPEATAKDPEAPRPAVDITTYKEDLVVLKGPENHYLVTSIQDMGERTFWGTTGTLHQLQGYSSSSSGGPDHYTEAAALFIAHNLPPGKRLQLRWENRESTPKGGGQWLLHCGDDPVPLTVVESKEANNILKQASFHGQFWNRRPIALARDEFGTYYYVDEHHRDPDPERIHVYTGWMGDMTKSKLMLVARDSKGSIFSTRTGDRRLIIDTEMLRWIEDGIATPLRDIPVDENWAFIHRDLGAYANQQMGTPCDLFFP